MFQDLINKLVAANGIEAVALVSTSYAIDFSAGDDALVGQIAALAGVFRAVVEAPGWMAREPAEVTAYTAKHTLAVISVNGHVFGLAMLTGHPIMKSWRRILDRGVRSANKKSGGGPARTPEPEPVEVVIGSGTTFL